MIYETGGKIETKDDNYQVLAKVGISQFNHTYCSLCFDGSAVGGGILCLKERRFCNEKKGKKNKIKRAVAWRLLFSLL